jgi:hypothetical protein
MPDGSNFGSMTQPRNCSSTRKVKSWKLKEVLIEKTATLLAMIPKMP